jgi:hypothetical protein
MGPIIRPGRPRLGTHYFGFATGRVGCKRPGSGRGPVFAKDNRIPGGGGRRTSGVDGRETPVSISTIKEQLTAYGTSQGLHRLEGRIQRGLDPSGLLGVVSTRAKLVQVAQVLGADMADVDTLSTALHTGGIWTHAECLAAGTDPAVQVWMIAGEATIADRQKMGDLAATDFWTDFTRINKLLDEAVVDPAGFLTRAQRNIITRSQEKYTVEDGVPVSKHDDGFVAMAVTGHRSGIVQADSGLLFVGANALDYDGLAALDLHKVVENDRDKPTTFYVPQDYQAGTPDQRVVKFLYHGFAIVFGGNREVAKALARGAPLAK